MWMILIAGVLIFLFLLIAGYIISSAAMYKVLKLFGYERPVLGWVPFARDYALGTICIQQCGSLPSVTGRIVLPNILLQWGWAVVLAAYYIPVVGYILGLGLSILYFGAVYRFVYSRLLGEDNVLFAVVSSAVRIIFYIRVLAFSHEGKGLYSQPGDVYPKGSAVQAGGMG